MRIPSASDKHYITVGHFFFFIFFFFSISYYKERALYLDNAFQFFQIINNQTLIFSENRYVSMLPQIIPLFASEFLSLKYVLITFSLSYWLLFYSIFLLVAYKLKNVAGAIIIILSLSLCVRHNYFYTVAEAHQGLIYCTLFFSWLNRNADILRVKNRYFDFLISFLLMLLCFFTHPFTSIILLFIIGFKIINARREENVKNYFLILFILIIYGAKVLFGNSNSYDGNYFQQLTKTASLLPQFFSLPTFAHLKDHFGMYFFPTMIFIYCFIYYLQRKLYLKVAFILIANLSFIVINAIIYNMGESYMMMEKAFMPVALFVGLPFANDILIKDKNNYWLKFFLFVFIVGMGVRGIYRSARVYSARVNYISTLCNSTKKYSGKKFIIERKNISDKIDVTWAFALETLLYSSLENQDSARTVYILEHETVSDINTENPNLFLCTPFWRDLNDSTLNKKYFNLPQEKYRLMEENLSEIK